MVRIGADGQLRTIPMTNTISTPKIGLGIGLYHDHPEFSIPRSCLNLAQDKEAKQHTRFVTPVGVQKFGYMKEQNRVLGN